MRILLLALILAFSAASQARMGGGGTVVGNGSLDFTRSQKLLNTAVSELMTARLSTDKYSVTDAEAMGLYVALQNICSVFPNFSQVTADGPDFLIAPFCFEATPGFFIRYSNDTALEPAGFWVDLAHVKSELMYLVARVVWGWDEASAQGFSQQRELIETSIL